MSRTILDFTPEGLKRRLADLERSVADLKRGQGWRFDDAEVEVPNLTLWREVFTATDVADLALVGEHWWTVQGNGGQTVKQRDASGSVVSSFAASAVGGVDQRVRGITTDGTNLWVAGSVDTVVGRYSTAGTLQTSFDPSSGGWTETGHNGVAYDGSGLWVTGSATLEARRFTTAGVETDTTNLSAAANPGGAAMFGGQLYITDGNRSRILVYSASGTFVESIPTDPEIMNPSGVFITGDGSLYVAEYGVGVFRYFMRLGAGVVTVRKDGVDIGRRQTINLVGGSGVSLTVADDAADDEVDVTIEATGGGGGGLTFIGEVELAADTASITFSSIPSSYRDLRITGIVRSTRAGVGTDSVAFRVGNGTVDSGSNYDWFLTRINAGTSSGAITNGDTRGLVSNLSPAGTATAGYFGSVEADILRYAETGRWRVIRSRAHDPVSSSTYVTEANTTTWKNTASVIDIVTLFPLTGNFLAGTVLALYGVT